MALRVTRGLIQEPVPIPICLTPPSCLGFDTIHHHSPAVAGARLSFHSPTNISSEPFARHLEAVYHARCMKTVKYKGGRGKTKNDIPQFRLSSIFYALCSLSPSFLLLLCKVSFCLLSHLSPISNLHFFFSLLRHVVSRSHCTIGTQHDLIPPHFKTERRNQEPLFHEHACGHSKRQARARAAAGRLDLQAPLHPVSR